MGLQVEERKLDIDEWRDGVASGEVTEVFACGTAAVVTPVGSLKWDGGETGVPAKTGEVATGSGKRWWTSSSAAPTTPSAGCTGSSEAAM